MEEWLEKNIINAGHWSILEHLHFTFTIDGISRACSHQLVRHRLASYAQGTQRKDIADSFEYVIPESIKNSAWRYRYVELMEELHDVYDEMISNKVCNEPLIPAEDARYILPNACNTSIVMTMNGRQLIETSRKRLCNKAQWEIRELFATITDNLYFVCPLIYKQMGKPCEFGKCPEGNKEKCS